MNKGSFECVVKGEHDFECCTPQRDYLLLCRRCKQISVSPFISVRGYDFVNNEVRFENMLGNICRYKYVRETRKVYFIDQEGKKSFICKLDE